MTNKIIDIMSSLVGQFFFSLYFDLLLFMVINSGSINI